MPRVRRSVASFTYRDAVRHCTISALCLLLHWEIRSSRIGWALEERIYVDTSSIRTLTEINCA